MSEFEEILDCGCKKYPGPMGAWVGSCDVHERPRGHRDWMAYAAAFRNCECQVCHRKGFIGDVTVDFETVGMQCDQQNIRLLYAHRTCMTSEAAV